MIDQIYIDVNSNYNFLVAVATLDQEKLKTFANVNGLSGNIETLCKSVDVEFAVLKQLDRAAKINELDNVEYIARVHIYKERFSVDNGLVTGT